MPTLLYLLLHLWKGAVRNILRSGARTLMGLFGIAWILSQVFFSLYGFSHGTHRLPLQLMLPLPLLETGLILILAMPVYGVMRRGLEGGLVAFNAPDIDFLFAMPFPQRWVLGFRLGLDALQLLGWVTLASLWFSPWIAGLIGVPIFPLAGRMAVALFLCFSIYHTVAQTLYIFYSYRVRASERLNAIVKYGGYLLGLSILASIALSALRGPTPWRTLLFALQHPVIRLFLLPIVLAVETILSVHPAYSSLFLPNLLMLIGLALGGVVGLFGQNENVYEPTLVTSRRKIRFREALRSGGFSAVRTEQLRERRDRRTAKGFAAPRLGSGWKALVWKNLQLSLRSPWEKLVISLLICIGIPLFLRFYLTPENKIYINMGTLGLLYITWIAGVTILVAVRSELTQGTFLKSLPIPAWKIAVTLGIVPTIGYILLCEGFLLGLALFFRDVPQPLLLPAAIVFPLMVWAGTLYSTLVSLLFPRQKDPLHKFFGSLLMIPGWILLFFLPLILSVVFLMDFVNLYTLNGSPSWNALFISEGTAALVVIYLIVCPTLAWVGGLAFRAFSPADE